MTIGNSCITVDFGVRVPFLMGYFKGAVVCWVVCVHKGRVLNNTQIYTKTRGLPSRQLGMEIKSTSYISFLKKKTSLTKTKI